MIKKLLPLKLLIFPIITAFFLFSYFSNIPTSQANNSQIILTQNQLPELPKPDNLPGPTDSTDENSPQDVQDYVLNNLIPMASQRIVTIIAFLAIVSLIFAGFKYYTAFGDEGKADEAKKLVQYSILGLVIALMSLAIVSIIGGLAQFFQ